MLGWRISLELVDIEVNESVVGEGVEREVHEGAHMLAHALNDEDGEDGREDEDYFNELHEE